jgi:hypothetical protein
MISDQLDVFPGHERFVHALLGMLSNCDAFIAALDHEQHDGGRCPDGPFIDFALGVVSFARTLRANLGTSGELDAGAPVAEHDGEPDVIAPASLLR